ncbi:MAG: lamin tail domain-containing protein [Candidatus Omnitrophota bacterium]
MKKSFLSLLPSFLGNLLIISIALGALANESSSAPILQITEFMADNQSTLTDEDGEYSDWIEIFNASDSPIDLKGWHLSDNPQNLSLWTFPSAILSPSRFLIVFASGKNRAVAVNREISLHANFQLKPESGYLALVEPDGQTVHHAFAPSYPAQRTDASYGLSPQGDDKRYFLKSTPGTANKDGVLGFVADTKFSQNRGFYDAPFELTITTDTPDAEIRYTTNGDVPSATTGLIYNGPIAISKTTPLRAAAFKPEYQPSNVDTQTYIFLDSVIRQTRPSDFPTRWGSVNGDYDMDPDVVNSALYKNTIKNDLKSIPTLSLVMTMDDLFGTRNGIYSHPEIKGAQWERPGSTELIFPDGTPGFHINNGVRIQGGYSRSASNLKYSFRLLFKNEYGDPKLNYPLFSDSNVDQFDTLTLRGSYNYSWHSHEGGFGSSIGRAEYLRDEFSRRTQLALGQPASHGTFVHLYLNGLYWGLYNICERPDDAFSSDHLGGPKDEWDCVTGGTRGINATQAKAGNKNGWNTLMTLANSRDLHTLERYREIQKYVNIPNLIDYMLTIYYTGNRDAPTVIGGGGTPWNFYSDFRRTLTEGFRFFCWDSEWTLEESNRNVVTFHYGQDNPAFVMQKLRVNPEFLMKFADHVQKHFFYDGALTPEKSIARYQQLADTIDRAIVGESARWGDKNYSTPRTRDNAWLPEVNRILTTYLPVRTQIVLQQLISAKLFPAIDAPVFNQQGGEIQPGFQLIMGGKSMGTQTQTFIAMDDIWKYEQSGTDLGADWKTPNFNDERWTSGKALLYVETAELSAAKNTPLTLGPPTFYFRKHFTIAPGTDLTNASLQMQTILDDGAVVYLNGSEILRLRMADGNVSYSDFANSTVSDAAIEGPFDIPANLLKAGDNVIAVEAHQVNATSSDVVFGLSLEATMPFSSDASGPIYYTLDGSDPRLPGGAVNEAKALHYAGPITLNGSVKVKARVLDGGVWSAMNEADFMAELSTTEIAQLQQNLRVTELMYNPGGDGAFEFIELQNTHPTAELNLSGAAFTNGVEYAFPVGTTLAPNQFLLLFCSDTSAAAFRAHYGLDDSTLLFGPNTGKLSNSGERIALEHLPSNTSLTSFNYNDGRGWPAQADGVGHSLVPLDSAIANESAGSLDYGGNWRASSYIGGSPGQADAAPIANIVMNEIMANTDYSDPAHPDYDSNDWIELYNASNAPVNMNGWYLSDDGADLKKWAFSALDIAARGFLTTDEISGFHNPITQGFALSKDGETLFLSYLPGKAGVDRIVDAVRFKAQEKDRSIGRFADGEPWLYAMEPTMGQANASGVLHAVIDEIACHPISLSSEDTIGEFLEIRNPTDKEISLANKNGAWRLDGGATFVFSPNLAIPPQGRLLVVNFDPQNEADRKAFKQKYNINLVGILIAGPYTGKLSNIGERVSLEKPLSVDALGQPDSWAIVDEVVYFTQSPWPSLPEAGGESLQRISAAQSGNNPANWKTAKPTPGVQGDTVVDMWLYY